MLEYTIAAVQYAMPCYVKGLIRQLMARTPFSTSPSSYATSYLVPSALTAVTDPAYHRRPPRHLALTRSPALNVGPTASRGQRAS